MALSRLLLRRLNHSNTISLYLFPKFSISGFCSVPTPKPSSLSARMSFIFDQIDEIDKKREEKDQTLQRIRAWRESKKQRDDPNPNPAPELAESNSVDDLKSELAKSEALLVNNVVKKEVELVHPWPEWIELMERLVQQNYFDHKRKDEIGMLEGIGFVDSSEAVAEEDKGHSFIRDFKTVQAAVVNFGRDRFDILRSLSRQDIQILVGYGCPSADKRVIYSAKLLRKHTHLDEGDVCSSCSLRGSCEKAFLLTNKEDEAKTMDVMRVLLAYGFDPTDGSVNKSVLKLKSVKTVIRKLLHEVVKLSAVPIDPNLPPPVFKKPPPKVKQAPPPPRKKVGRYDVEMKKGDWLCPKCDFLNFAKNTVCLQCEAKRPKRQLLPGEWECPQCNFLNYRRNTVCFHCEHKRPPDTYTEDRLPEKRYGPSFTMDKIPNRKDVSNAWNFDFDDNESDGADVAAFECADPRKPHHDSSPGNGHRDGFGNSDHHHKGFEEDFSDSGPTKPGLGFNDFDDEDDDDVDSYELVAQNEAPKPSRIDFSEFQSNSESEDMENNGGHRHARGKTQFSKNGKKPRRHRDEDDDSDVDFGTDDDLPVHPDWKSSHVANPKQQNRGRGRRAMSHGSDDDLEFSSGSDDNKSASFRSGNRGAFNARGRARGGRSSFTADSFSESDSDDGRSYRSRKQGGNRGGKAPMSRSRPFSGNSFSGSDSDDGGSYRSRINRGGKAPMSRSRPFSADSFSRSDSDDGGSYRSRKQGGNRGGKAPMSRSRPMNDRKSSSNGGFNRGGNKRGLRENSHDRGRQGGSFAKQGRRPSNLSSQSDSYLDDDRHQRPRKNVR